MLGTALYPTYCMMNHSCLANIANLPLLDAAGRERVGVNVFAAEAIAEGAEVFNTYLTVSPHALTRRQRRAHLRQYQFECECTLCRSQPLSASESDSDSDSSDSDSDD
jgi:hypothetical protein